MVKKGLQRRLCDIEHERRRANKEIPFISTSGVSASYLSNGHEYWAPMDPIYYHEKSLNWRNGFCVRYHTIHVLTTLGIARKHRGAILDVAIMQ